MWSALYVCGIYLLHKGNKSQTVWFRFYKELFSQMVQKNIRQKTKRVQGVGLVDIGSISPAGRSWKPATESVHREGHRAPPFSATPPEFGERAVCETFGQDNYFWEQMFILPRFLRSILNDERWLVFLVMFILAAHVVGLVVIVLFY